LPQPTPCETDIGCPAAELKEFELEPECQEWLRMYRRAANQLTYDFGGLDTALTVWGYFPGMKKTQELWEMLVLIHSIKSDKDNKPKPGQNDTEEEAGDE
jgi:hypothetical protein